jgi:D-glutamate cyclase
VLRLFMTFVVTLQISFLGLFASLHGSALSDKIARIERIIQQDPRNRGVCNFYTTALFDAAKTLQQSNSVAILTGFFIPSAQQPETDGPLGALFLAESLLALGKQVVIVTDQPCLPAITACVQVLEEQGSFPLLSVAVFPEAEEEQAPFVSSLCEHIDCLVSIERVGRTFDGTYRSMRAIDITNKTAPLDDLFLYAQNHPSLGISTVSVGDGGNEIGMGSKIAEVKAYIPRGEQIACVIPSDHLIVAGVSNWGGYALAGALWCLTSEKSDGFVLVDQVYPPVEEQFQMLKNMILLDCCDGVLGKPILSVDGLPWEVHQQILADIRSILE